MADSRGYRKKFLPKVVFILRGRRKGADLKPQAAFSRAASMPVNRDIFTVGIPFNGQGLLRTNHHADPTAGTEFAGNHFGADVRFGHSGPASNRKKSFHGR